MQGRKVARYAFLLVTIFALILGFARDVLINEIANIIPLPHWLTGTLIVVAALIIIVLYEWVEVLRVWLQDGSVDLQDIQFTHMIFTFARVFVNIIAQRASSIFHALQKRLLQARGRITVKSDAGMRPLPTSPQDGQPTEARPALLCFAIDVSYSMRNPLLTHTGEAIKRRTNLRTIVEQFVDLSIATVQDPATQEVFPRYHLMAYGFGFKETAYAFGLRKTKGGPVRDLLAHPSLPALPSATQLHEHWNDYRNNMLSSRDFTVDLFGKSPMCQALRTIRDRIKAESQQRTFTPPILLAIISDGGTDDGDPAEIIDELHAMGVLTLCCYMASKDVLAAKRLYTHEDTGGRWPAGAQRLFRYASPLNKSSYISRAMFDYLNETGWQPREGARLFTQVNQTEALDRFLEILLSGLKGETRE